MREITMKDIIFKVNKHTGYMYSISAYHGTKYISGCCIKRDIYGNPLTSKDTVAARESLEINVQQYINHYNEILQRNEVKKNVRPTEVES